MLSNKLAVSLLSLTLLIALTFGTPHTAPAAEFNVQLTDISGPLPKLAANGFPVDGIAARIGSLPDVSHQAGIQLARLNRAGDIKGGTQVNRAVLFLRFHLKFDRAVRLQDSHVSVAGYRDHVVFGGPNSHYSGTTLANIPSAGLGNIPGGHRAISPQIASKTFTVDISLEPISQLPAVITDARTAATSFVTKVKLKINKIPSADLFNDDMSKELNIEVDLLYANPGTLTAAQTADPNDTGSMDRLPDVYKIGLVGEPYSPITTETFQVQVLLSEEPRGGFKKELLEVSNADIVSVVKLVPPTELPKITPRGGTGALRTVTVMETRTRQVPVDPRDPTGPQRTETYTVSVQRQVRDSPLVPTTVQEAYSWRDRMLHMYMVTLRSKPGNQTVVIKVKEFAGMERPTNAFLLPSGANSVIGSLPQEMYTPDPALLTEGRDKLTLKTSRPGTPAAAKLAGLRFALPKDKVIPGNGYLVVTEDKGGSAIKVPPGKINESPKAHERTPVQLLYNVIDDGDLPNLETFLSNGGVIDVVGPRKLTITEVMWGSDASLDDTGKSQWIELHNPGGEYKTQDGGNTTYLIFYNPNELSSLPAKSSVKDRIGTITESGAYWSLAGKGQSGRTGQGERAGDLSAVGSTSRLVSMYRKADSDGRMAGSWMASTPPSLNFDSSKVGTRVGSPGAAKLVTQAERDAAAAAAKARESAAAAAAAAASDTSVSMPKVGRIYISEVMFARGGTLPQWIEIANGSRTEQVNLGGWTLKIENAAADADVSVGSSITFTIPNGTLIDPSAQKKKPSTVLVVTEAGRNNLPGAMARGQVINVWDTYQTDLILAGVANRRYSLLSDMGFMITLAPPAPAAAAGGSTPAAQAAAKAANAKAMRVHAAATDKAGNLGADGAAMWDLPMTMEGGRSSLIRGHMPARVGPAEPKDGMMMASWRLAADTGFAQGMHLTTQSYYGAANDVGTPGFRAGGALPVELSSFRPERHRDTGEAIITWSTQSELNNAGFFIKRSQQRDGEFKVINAVMVPGAGTTSEKQTYSYTDTTADPNVVYYYQIEDVSLDGQRETLTRGIRLRGHIGAAGKATVLWGQLKGSRE